MKQFRTKSKGRNNFDQDFRKSKKRYMWGLKSSNGMNDI